MKLKKQLKFTPLVAASLVLSFILLVSILDQGGQQFSMLARSFLHGQLNFRHSIGGLGHDPLNYRGKIYWGEGPFPAILLMPFELLGYAFHFFFYQGYINFILILGILWLLFHLARHLDYNVYDSALIGLTFVLGSVCIGLTFVASSWLYAQTVTTFLLILGLHEYLTRAKTRWWLLGLIASLLLLTRATAAPIIIFFTLELIFISKKEGWKISRFAQLCLPILLAVILIALYNWLRFGSPLNGGFQYQLLFPASKQSSNLGLFSLLHIPANLYALILRAPLTILRTKSSWTLKFPYIANNIYGMSIFFTSPYFLNLFTYQWSAYSRQLKNLFVATAISALGVLSFYGLGLQQYGYRYSMDFLPGLFIIFIIIYRTKHSGLTIGMKSLMYFSIALNLYLAIPYYYMIR